jgi:hypothetical protein
MSRVKPITRAERLQLRASVKQAIEHHRAALSALNQPEEACVTEALKRLAGTGKPLDELRHVPPHYLPNIVVMVAVTARQAKWFADGGHNSEQKPTETEVAIATEVLERHLCHDDDTALVAQMKTAAQSRLTLNRIPRALAPHRNALSVRSRLIGRVKGAVLTYCGQSQYALVMALSDIALGFKTGTVKKAWVYEATTPAELLEKLLPL